jgi:hypothetical protein
VEDRHVSDVIYLYGFVPRAAPAPSGVRGIADAPVSLLDLGGLCAAVSHLPADQYAADGIEARLQDLAWVGQHGLAHESVVTWFADHSDIVPARMFSLYSGEPSLRNATSPQLDSITTALQHIASRREWNLKVAYDPQDLAAHGAQLSDEVRAADEEIATAPPGRRYLLQKRRTDLVRQELSRMARRAADEMLSALSGHAEQSRVLPIAATDDAGTVILNAALLVARSAEPDLRATAARLHDHYTRLGLIVSFSGPWAPYRFLEPNGLA